MPAQSPGLSRGRAQQLFSLTKSSSRLRRSRAALTRCAAAARSIAFDARLGDDGEPHLCRHLAEQRLGFLDSDLGELIAWKSIIGSMSMPAARASTSASGFAGTHDRELEQFLFHEIDPEPALRVVGESIFERLEPDRSSIEKPASASRTRCR
jgi:hypothetical protein